MKRLLKLPRKYRNIIGCTTVLGGMGIYALLGLGEEWTLLLSVPLVLFFAWLCPELWDGKQ